MMNIIIYFRQTVNMQATVSTVANTGKLMLLRRNPADLLEFLSTR